MANMGKTMSNLKRLGRTEDVQTLERTKTRDLESGQVSVAVYWTCHEVADYIEALGFPQYRVRNNRRNTDCLLLKFRLSKGMLSSK